MGCLGWLVALVLVGLYVSAWVHGVNGLIAWSDPGSGSPETLEQMGPMAGFGGVVMLALFAAAIYRLAGFRELSVGEKTWRTIALLATLALAALWVSALAELYAGFTIDDPHARYGLGALGGLTIGIAPVLAGILLAIDGVAPSSAHSLRSGAASDYTRPARPVLSTPVSPTPISRPVGGGIYVAANRPPASVGYFTCAMSGRRFPTDSQGRSRYQATKAYKDRRAAILRARPRCDQCGAPATAVWAISPSAWGRESTGNCTVLCGDCHGRAYRLRR